MRTIYKIVLLPLLLFLIPNQGFATHIVGGTLTYTYSGVGNTYSVTLILYRDCGAAVAFPASADITVLQADGTLFSPDLTFTLPGGAISAIPLVLPPCATSPTPAPCTQQRVYTATVSIPASPGGVHMYFSIGNRNAAAVNIVSPLTMGETFYAYIPCYRTKWAEDFNLANGTTSDAGPTAWTRTLGTTAPTSAQVNLGEFEVVGSNNGMMVWASQVIPISTYTNGVNLSVNVDKAGANFGNQDSLKLFYAINGGAKVAFPVNGSLVGNWTGPLFAKATGLTGTNIQIFARTKFNANNNSTGKTYYFDMVSVYDNTFLPNSNPTFVNLPPLLFCSSNSFSFSQGAVDLDGDSLAYTMYTPYTFSPTPSFPNNVASIPTVTWAAGYSATSPFNSGGPSVTLNPTTGVMTGVQNANGGRVFGVKCAEYRNGLLLSETVRDYEVTAVTCPPFVPSAPGTTANTPLCAGQNLNLTATFSAGATYSWTGPNGFTSTSQNPGIVGTSTLASGTYSCAVTVAGCTGPPGTVVVTVNPNPASPVVAGNSPVCSGTTLSLTAATTAGATYSWVGPNSFISAAQNPTLGGVTLAAAGTYSLIQTVLGCTSPNSTVTIAVNQTPVAPTAGANTPLCQGTTLNLSATFSAGATYSWTGPNSFTANTQNPSLGTVPLVGGGIYSVAATIAGCPGPAGTISVTVIPTPAAPVAGGTSTLCEGQNLSLTASFTTGATYNWAGPNGFTSTNQNPSIAGITLAGSGIYSVNATIGGCAGPNATFPVTVNPIPIAPTAGANTPLCAGLTLSLTSTFSAGATYLWSGPNSFTSNVQNPTLAGSTPLATGLYSVAATILGCSGVIGTVSVNVSIPPSPPVNGANTPVCVGQTLSLTATFTAGLSYTWAGPNAFSANTQNTSIAGITLAGNGTYSVFATTAGGCAGPISTIPVTVNPIPAAPTAGVNSPICAGQNFNFTAAPGGGTFSWSGPNSFTSNVQNPAIAGASTLAAGVYSVFNTVIGCTSPAGTVSAVVNPIPSAPVAGSNSTLCAGQSINLTASNGGTSYNWTGPNGFTSLLQNPVIPAATTAASGNYSVTQTILGCTGPMGTTGVTVNPIPAIPTAGSNGPICAFQTLSLTALPNGLSYSWSGPNSFTSAIQNPSISSTSTLAAGAYSLTVTSLGCASPAGTLNVVVNPAPFAPTAAGTSTLCAGGTINLSAASTATVFNWTGPNAFTSTLQNPSIAGASTLATGIYSVTATQAGCTGPAGTVSITVFGNPSSPTLTSNSPVCTGQILSFTANLIVGATYAWTGPNGFSSSAQNPTIPGVTSAAGGSYSVAVNVSGCGSAVNVIPVTVNSTPAAPTAASNGPLCAGQNLSLTANPGGGSFLWTGPNSFTSALQNPTIAGTSTLASGVYSVNNTVTGCTGAIGTISVTVNPIPASPTASGTSTLCAGQNLSLTASNGGTSYNWTGPNSFSSVSQNPVIVAATTLASGTYSVTQTILGCTSSAGIVNATVNPIPAAPTVGSNGPICAFQTLSLTALPNGLSYTWSGPNSFTSTSQNPNIAAASTLAGGTYSLIVTSLGCSNTPGTTSVVVNTSPPAPTASGTSTLCTGGTISLTATSAATIFSWSGPNSFTSSLQNPLIAGATTLATGMYSVTGTIAGCTGPAGIFSVTILGNPSSPTLTSNSPLCTGQTLSLSANPVSGATYAWTGPNGFNSAAQSPTLSTVTLAAAGSYSVMISVAGCGSAVNIIAVSVNTIPASPTASSNGPICAGQNLNLNAAASGTIYAWSGPNSFTSALQNPTLTAATTTASGTYSVVQIVNGCSSAAGTISVTINPIPAVPGAGGPGSICAGQNLNLTAGGAGPSYNWSGPNSFTSTVQNPVIAGASTLASGVYSVSQTNLGCTSALATVGVTVNAIPSAPTATNNSPICALQTLSLSAAGAGTIFGWTGPNGFSSAAQNPNITSAPLAAAGTYSVTQTILGCTSLAGTVAVTINPAAPTPTAVSNSPLCLGLNISFTQTPISGATYSWTGPNGFNSSVLNPTIISPPVTASGNYSVFATVAGCPGQTLIVSVLVSQPGTVTTGSSQTVCANNSTVALNATSSTGSGTWLSSGSGVFAPNAANGNYIPSAGDITAGSVTMTLTSTNNGGCISVSNTLSVFFTPAPTATAIATQSVCANNATVSLNGTVTIASGGIWSTSGTGSFVPSNTVLSASYVPSAADITAGTFTISLTTTGNGNCFPVTNSKVITITPAPVVVPGPNPQVVCKSSPNFQLNGSSTSGSGIWASSGTGTFSSINVLNPIYFPSVADTSNGSVTLTLTSTNNLGCNSVSRTMTLVYVSTITVNAGGNKIICSNVSVPLSGIATTSAGIWTSSGTGTFSPSASSLVTNYIPSAADVSLGIVNLTLTTANNGGCAPISSAIIVTITPGPTANAGASQTVCANNAISILTGSFTGAGGGKWLTSGTGSFAPSSTSMIVSYSASAADTTAGSVVITLSTTSNGSCTASTSTLLINFKPAPVVNAGADISVCRNNAVVLINGYSSTGSGTWSALGSGTLSPNNAVLSPTYTPSTADTTAGFVKLILTSFNNGSCNPVRDTVKIVFSPIPQVFTGINPTVCANNANVVLTGTSSTGSGNWSTLGGGTFTPNGLSGTYIPSGADIAAGTVTLLLNSTNNGGCAAVSKQMTVSISTAPSVNAGTDKTLCSNSISVSLSGSYAISTGALWSSSGTGTFLPGSANMTANYHFSPSDTSGGTLKIYISSTGNGNCLQVKDSMLITFTKGPSVDAGLNFSVCPGLSAALNGSSSAGTGFWSTAGSGFFSNASTLNPIYTPSTNDITKGTVKLTLNSGPTSCGAAMDSLVLSFKTKPKALFTFSSTCLGTATSFTDLSVSQSTLKVVSWLWRFNSDTSTKQHPKYTYKTVGQNTAALIVSDGICSDSTKRTLFVNPLPKSSFNYENVGRYSVQFIPTATVSNGALVSWNWLFGDAGNSNVKDPLHAYPDSGRYVASLLVMSDSSCVGNFSYTVIVPPVGEPAVPSGFTPNDDGVNDILFVKGGPFNTLDFRVFNEWGEQIFQSNIQSSGWDGRYKEAPQPVGKFIWTVNGELIDGKKVKMAGEVILHR
ncbi:MAG: gliding motility-associated C-terminal domain-containing protein [bacterium]|nr:gliding motility-associated C-terminal domain-containing protein [bacterium]